MTPELAAAQTPAKGALARMIGVFTDTRETFADIGRRPSWIAPLLLIVAVQLLVVGLVTQRVGWEKTVRENIEKSSAAQNLSAEQIDNQVRVGAKFGAVFALAGVAIGVPVVMLVMAGVLMATVNMVGGNVNFKQSRAVVAHASLIGVIAAILTIIVLYAKPPDEFDIQNALAFNVGAFLSAETTSKAVMALARSLDLFSFLTIGMLAAGYSAVSGKLTFGKACVAVVVPWAVFVLCRVGWNAIF